MRHGSLRMLLLAASSLALGCEGREVSVFELPALTVGGAGSAGSAGSTSDAGVGAIGGDVATSGSSSGGSFADGGALATSGGSAGEENGNGGGRAGAGGRPPCGADSDCMPGWLCEKKGCDALTGVCVPWPPICLPDPAPVCGCDGVTYWNDCIRLQSHARLQGLDQCRATACTCEVGADCMVPYASCSHLLPPGETCGPSVGACWVLPQQCPPRADASMWRACKPALPGEQPACLDTCQAIASERSHAPLHRNEVCE